MAGLLRVVSADELAQAEQAQAALDISQHRLAETQSQHTLDNLAGHLRTEFSRFRRHRTERNLEQRYMDALRAYRGEYSPHKLAAIQKFGGSEVYSRISAVKCRGAAALLKDIYISTQPWAIEPTEEPAIPQELVESVTQLVDAEVHQALTQGFAPPPEEISRRTRDLLAAVESAIARTAQEDAERAEGKLKDILQEGGFDHAFAEFLIDLMVYPIAVLKGPVVEMRDRLQWVDGEMKLRREPVMLFKRRDPYYIHFSPGATCVEEADIMEVTPLTRNEIVKLIGVAGYNEKAIRAVLDEYGRGGLRDWLDDRDQEHAVLTDVENHNRNESHLIDMLEYSGHIQGRMLREYGMSDKLVRDPDIDYACKVWVIGRHTIKAIINPNPARKHEYYGGCFEPVPGSIYGVSLIETLEDVQDIANASLRALVNNMSISSGPQVTVNTDRLDPSMDADDLHPWKRWRVNTDPLASSGYQEPPVAFFQPSSNANELLGVYKEMTLIADEISAIPRYITGSDKVGGAGETASGLAMLMGNASKVLQGVAMGIDKRVMDPLLRTLYTYVMLTDTSGALRGDEQIVVKGVAVAMQRETDRMRKLEFLQLTTNPVDLQVTGVEGRADMLRDVSKEVGFARDPIPTALQIKDRQRQEEEAARLQALTGGRVGAQSVANNAPPPGAAQPPRTALADNTGGL